MAICLGLMSGTSMDGIDAALLDTDGHNNVRSLGGAFLAYPKIFQLLLKAAEWTARQHQGDARLTQQHFSEGWRQYLNSLHLDEKTALVLEQQALSFMTDCLSQAQKTLSFSCVLACSTELHRQACLLALKQSGLSLNQLDLIGYHGQTLYHNPQQGISWQAGDGQYLADALQCPVIHQFRQNDLHHGGQGAPLVPLYHQALVKQRPCYPTMVINCGGIANVTVVSGPESTEVLAFDAGPGNVLLDRVIKQATAGQQSHDHDGLLARQGQVCERTLKLLKQQALPKGFLHQPPPKSLDSHDCQLPSAFDQLALVDGLATLAALTADCLVDSLQQTGFLSAKTHIVLAGGGWYHPVIKQQFEQRLQRQCDPMPPLSMAQQLNWQHDFLEAEAFAYLAQRSVLGLSLSTPHTTGVSQACSGGICFYPSLS